MFEERARGSEFLDRPKADPRLVERSYGFMKFVNRAGGGTRVVQDFLARELAGSDSGLVRILDLGSADADIPLTVTQWAAARGYELEFTCLDHNAKAVELARQAIESAGVGTITVERADVFTYRPDRDFDYAIGSMFFHHLTATDIGRLIQHLRGFVRKALLINDLHRCTLNWLVCRLLAIGIEPEIRHDALLSIRRGFKPAELTGILWPHDPAARVETRWFCRVAGIVRFDRKEGTCRQS